MRILTPAKDSPSRNNLPVLLKGQASPPREERVSPFGITFVSRIGSTCDLGVQSIALTPGASSTCGGGNCSCSSCCCW